MHFRLALDQPRPGAPGRGVASELLGFWSLVGSRIEAGWAKLRASARPIERRQHETAEGVRPTESPPCILFGLRQIISNPCARSRTARKSLGPRFRKPVQTARSKRITCPKGQVPPSSQAPRLSSRLTQIRSPPGRLRPKNDALLARSKV